VTKQAKTFTLGQLLSVMTDRLLCPIGDLYDILNHLTQDDLFTHQLPRASRECKPTLLKRYPQLASVDASGVTPENWQTWLSAQEAKFGKTFEVLPVHPETHEVKNPITEAIEMVGQDRVIGIRVGDKEE